MGSYALQCEGLPDHSPSRGHCAGARHHVRGDGIQPLWRRTQGLIGPETERLKKTDAETRRRDDAGTRGEEPVISDLLSGIKGTMAVLLNAKASALCVLG